MIDMHIHTKYSDGTDSLIELLEKAEKLKLNYISITDHDTCKFYDELKKINYKKIYSGKIIPGIEIKCFYKQRTIEVLGYNIDTNIMQKWLDDFYNNKSREKLQVKYFNIFYDKCLKMGLVLEEKNNIQWNPKNDWASYTIYSEIKKHQENKLKVPEDMWETFSTFNRKYCSDPNYILYIDKSDDYPSFEQVINAIKSANGLVFMPHIFIYKWVEDKYKFINEIIENYKIDGFECYYTDFTDKQTQYLLRLCDKNNLLKSGGSDYHGMNKEKISLGTGYGNLNIQDSLIENWI